MHCCSDGWNYQLTKSIMQSHGLPDSFDFRSFKRAPCEQLAGLAEYLANISPLEELKCANRDRSQQSLFSTARK